MAPIEKNVFRTVMNKGNNCFKEIKSSAWSDGKSEAVRAVGIS